MQPPEPVPEAPPFDPTGTDGSAVRRPLARSAPRSLHAWFLALGVGLTTLGLAVIPPASGAEPVPGPQQGGGNQGNQERQTQVLSYPPATADSNHRMIAVTGVDITGSSVLYLVDTINYRLAVYQANGGTENSQGIQLIGARRIDLDLKLHGLNDRSKYTYEALREEFASQGLLEEGGSIEGER